jgi:hypothetical protein
VPQCRSLPLRLAEVRPVTRQISEADWKVFRQLHKLALERFCERALAELSRLASEPGKGAHERYLTVFKLLERRDEELAEAFDDFRRSTAWRQLAVLRGHGLLTEEEFARFSDETRAVVQVWLGGDGPNTHKAFRVKRQNSPGPGTVRFV